MKSIVQDATVIILAAGDTDAAKAAARGHLFEQFMAQVMHNLGYARPTSSVLNRTADGSELDIDITHELNRSRAIAECKAYRSNIDLAKLSNFYGKLCYQRLVGDNPGLQGFFFAIPRFTAEAREYASEIEKKDDKFRTLTAVDINELMQSRGLAPKLNDDEQHSDPALIVHATGQYAAALQLDSKTRMAHCVDVTARTGAVPQEVLDLLATHPYAQGLPIVDISVDGAKSPNVDRLTASQPLVEVRGSDSDFQYQFPASPRYFVGRKKVSGDLDDHITANAGPFVLNAQSGWGKSSLALKVASRNKGVSLVLDTRTANSPSYVSAALRKAGLRAEQQGRIILPPSASWASVDAAVSTIAQSEWIGEGSLLVIFDQFENVFTNHALTQEFRNLALLNREESSILTVGYCWKTDFVDWIENHPYQLRDQIKSSSRIWTLAPLVSREVDLVLRRLEKQIGAKLTRELRQRLREYSLGLPWLLKKLSGHLISEISAGKTQEQLIGEALNIQSLFDSDLAKLGPEERDALNFIAQWAPVRAAEITERFNSSVVQSLVDERLIVQVGDKLDTYWDTFRDYLNSGRVPIEDSFILRIHPNSVAGLVSELLAANGATAIADVAAAWEVSEKSVGNSARELRQLGLASLNSGTLTLLPELLASENVEHELRRRVATSLRRHRAFSAFAELSERGQGRVSIPEFSSKLQETFTSIEGTPHTWTQYASTFLAWFEYAGLIMASGPGYSMAPEGAEGKGSLTTRSPRALRTGTFPTSAAGPALKLLIDSDGVHVSPPSGKKASFNQLIALRAIKPVDENSGQYLIYPNLMRGGEVDPAVLLGLLRGVPGGPEAISLLEADPAVSATLIGGVFGKAQKVTWTDSTRDLVGRSFFAWARAAGLKTQRKSRSKPNQPSKNE